MEPGITNGRIKVSLPAGDSMAESANLQTAASAVIPGDADRGLPIP